MIEMDASEAIERIRDHIAQFAFVDGLKSPIILARNADILKSKGIVVESRTKGNKIEECHIKAADGQTSRNIITQMVISSNGDSEAIAQLDSVIRGVTFKPVTLTSKNAEILVDINANGVILFTNKGKSCDLTLTPNPRTVYNVDLQMNDTRQCNVIMNNYHSGTHFQTVLKNKWFYFSFFGGFFLL